MLRPSNVAEVLMTGMWTASGHAVYEFEEGMILRVILCGCLGNTCMLSQFRAVVGFAGLDVEAVTLWWRWHEVVSCESSSAVGQLVSR